MNVFDLCLITNLILFILGLTISTIFAKKHPFDIEKEDLIIIIILSILRALQYVALAYVLKYLPMFLTNIMLNTNPFITTILAYFFLCEEVTWV